MHKDQCKEKYIVVLIPPRKFTSSMRKMEKLDTNAQISEIKSLTPSLYEVSINDFSRHE